jgi:hypothetical protein
MLPKIEYLDFNSTNTHLVYVQLLLWIMEVLQILIKK